MLQTSYYPVHSRLRYCGMDKEGFCVIIDGNAFFAPGDDVIIFYHQQHKVVLVHSRLGIAPSHYAALNSTLHFASEIKFRSPFLAVVRMKQQPDIFRNALVRNLAFRELLEYLSCKDRNTAFAQDLQVGFPFLDGEYVEGIYPWYRDGCFDKWSWVLRMACLVVSYICWCNSSLGETTFDPPGIAPT